MAEKLEWRWWVITGAVPVAATVSLMLAWNLPLSASVNWQCAAVVWAVVPLALVVLDRATDILGGMKRWWAPLLASVPFCVLIVLGKGTDAFAGVVPFVVPALLCGLFETTLFFFWLRRRLTRALSPLAAIVVSAVFYALHHVAYYSASSGGLAMFGPSLGVYIPAGVLMAALAARFESALSLWPLVMTAGMLSDLARLGYAQASPGQATMTAGVGLILVLAAMVWRLVTGTGTAIVPDRGLLRCGMPPVRRLLIAGVWLAVLTALGLYQRLIINDPVVVEGVIQVFDSYRFAYPRDFVQDLLLRSGYVVFLGVPILAMYMWHDASERRRQTGDEGLGPAVTGAATALVPIAAAFAVALLASLWTPVSFSLGHAARFAVLALASVGYGVMVCSITSAISIGVDRPAMRWFVLLLAFIFTFNWWMLYPLFSQYSVVGPYPVENLEMAATWVNDLWSRATPLYSLVPHYHYYMGLTVSYSGDVLDNQLVGTHLAMLLGYSGATFLLARAVSQPRSQ